MEINNFQSLEIHFLELLGREWNNRNWFLGAEDSNGEFSVLKLKMKKNWNEMHKAKRNHKSETIQEAIISNS